ncbi:alpha/beta hydrolase family protein [Marinimicrobium agarilyticum]|uniref:alpha/beta hydrolase family protein n=1 Tax=Marinimicrobium agarilyticum TaxID=306546 RepID=UPI0004012194|nr:prolyl oligopeptidase family serine peptidase [Marinimicrobium agarilyticum]
MKRTVPKIVCVILVLSAVAASGSELVDFGEYKVIYQKDCFSGSHGNYDEWIDNLVKLNKRNKTQEDKQAARERLHEAMPAELHEHYKTHLTCNWFSYLVDGGEVWGYIIKPKQVERELPVIIYNRGGNLDFGGMVFGRMFNELFPYADEGFIVIGSQYRGTFSKSDDSDFSDQFGGDDVNDVLELLNIIPHIEGADSSKITMVGHSRGAIQTLLVLRRTDEVKAVAALAGVYDLEEGLRRRPGMERVFEARIPNYSNAKHEELAKRSALLWADELDKSVPVLLVHGQADKRASATHSLNLAQAFQENSHPYKLVIYPMEDHGFRGRRKEVTQLVLDWLNEQLN